jgi:hypothetical protein
MRSFIICNPPQHYEGDKLKEYETRGECRRMAENTNVYKLVVEKHKGKIPLGRAKPR